MVFALSQPADEITWYGIQPVDWLRANDPRGHFEMPGLRHMSLNGTWYYTPNFDGDQESIKNIWNNQGDFGGISLRAGEVLTKGKSLISENKIFELRFQFYGNVVLYDVSKTPNITKWATNTDYKGNNAKMQWYIYVYICI